MERAFDERSRLVRMLETGICWLSAFVAVAAMVIVLTEFHGCVPEPATLEVRQ